MPVVDTQREIRGTVHVQRVRAQQEGADEGDTVAFAGVAYTGGRLRVGGFRDGVVIDLAGITLPESVPVTADHSSSIDNRLGRLTASIEDNRLRVRGELVTGSPQANRAAQLLRNGGVGLSIGALPTRVEFVEAGDEIEVNGQALAGPVEVARESELIEVAHVGVGADNNAGAIAASRKQGFDSMENDTQQDVLTAERERVGEINAAFRGLGDEGRERADALIESGETADVARGQALELIRAKRPAISGVRADEAGEGMDGNAITAAALCHAGRGELAASEYGERAAEQGEKLAAKAGSLMGIMRHGLAAAGAPEPKNERELIKASFSTDSMTGALAQSISVTALDAFRKAPEAWRSHARRMPLSDFREGEVARLAGNFRFRDIGPGGELKHSSTDVEKSPIQLRTTGTVLTLTREALINDSAIGLIADAPAELGAEAARVVGDDMATLLADTGNQFFNSGNANLLDGVATAALSSDGVAAAAQKLREQTDSSGRRLNLAPAFLVVSAAGESTARAILNSRELSRESSSDGLPTGNPVFGLADLLVDARLGDTEWFMFSAPQNAGSVVATLGGRDAPVIEQMDAAGDVLGTSWRAYFDHGAILHEPRAVIKSTGVTS